ncbi:branched-chain amino acid ABC transporter permease, partial [Frankia tisae]|uniref:branched-chain amino acid ABC transporter permease n=2 Tax=Frankia tisae TaxID=2950104 RepID=UPI0021BDF84D
MKRPRTPSARLRTGVPALVVVAILAVILAKGDYRANFFSGGGFALGALVAAIALGVVVTYRGSGVVNLAGAAVAMYAAYVYADLRARGDLFLPPLPNPLAPIEGIVHRAGNDSFTVPHWPTSVSFGGAMGFWPALVLALVFCALFGLVLHVAVFRPLRHAPVLAKVVASVGVLLFLQAVVVRRFSTTTQVVGPLPFVDKTQVDLGLFKITQEQLFVVCLVLVLAVALWALFQRSRFGLAVRAAAENEKGATVLGFSADRLAAATWVLSTVVTGLLGIFVASVNSSVDPNTMPALIVPAVTAALVGGFTSFGWTTLAAFGLGMQVSLVTFLGANESWFPKAGGLPVPGVDLLVPLVVIVAVLALRGQSLPTRGVLGPGRLPFSPTARPWSLRYGGPGLAVVALIPGVFFLSPAMRDGLTNTLTGIVICLSIVVLTGFIGQISLAQTSFAGLSAYTVASLSTHHGWPFPLPILAGAAVAVVAGVLVALPALRVRGVHLAIATLAFAVAVDKVVFANSWINGGFDGATVTTPALIRSQDTDTHHVLGVTIGDGTQPNPLTLVFCLVVVVALGYLVANLRRSLTGRQMLAIRSNERAAAAAGVNVAAVKVLAFGVSAFIAGVGGAVIAYRTGNVTPDKFLYDKSLMFFAFAYLGGIASVSGAVTGGLLVGGGLGFTILNRVFGLPDEFVLLLGGLGLVVTAVLNPEGVAGKARTDLLALRRRFRPPT